MDSKRPSRKPCICVPATLVVLKEDRTGHTGSTYLDSSQEDDSSASTLLSAASYDVSMTDDEEEDVEFEQLTVPREARLTRLRRRNARRDQVLEHISRVKSPTLIKLIRQRELMVRQAKYELLFLQHLYEDCLGTDGSFYSREDYVKEKGIDTDTNESLLWEVYDDHLSANDMSSRDDSTVWYDARCELSCETPPETVNVEKNIINTLHDYAVIEWHTTIPAVVSLIIHSLAHAALYDGVEILFEEFRKYCEMLSKRTNIIINPTALGHSVMFLLGVTMLRLSGQLYWWLNNSDFRCVKFDLHNRLHLRHWDALVLKWMNYHTVIQALLYFIGYQFCFMVVNDIFDMSFHFFDQREEILKGLPSFKINNTGHRAQLGTFFLAPSCQDESIAETANNDIILQDFEYLHSVLDFKSFEAYFYDWARELVDDLEDGDSPYPMLAPSTSMLVCFAVAVASVFLLHQYGFGVFHKY